MNLIRSFLFAPANQPDRLKKFLRIAADCFVIDLEDGTPEAEKESARAALPEIVAYLRQENLQGLLFVRVNEPRSPHLKADLRAAFAADIDGIVVPKIEEQDELKPIASALTMAQFGSARELSIIGGIESMRGVINVFDLVNVPNLSALYFGAEDYITDIDGRRTVEGHEVLYARSQTVLAAKAAGIQALDQAVVEIRDEQRYRDCSAQGRNLGYGGKICLLPRQVEMANELFSPTDSDIERSRRLITAYESAAALGTGAIEFEGRMVDGPLLKRAQSIVAFAHRLAEMK
ncbi:MAG TPA: CoA ester lyase [Spongiibacteraceae bacterium]|nr:CoA ester lyase [Spongiibacteraceae bacterium]